MVMGSCEIHFRQKQDYHVLNPLPSLYPNQLAETKVFKKYSFSEKIAFWTFAMGILFKLMDKDTLSTSYRRYSSHPATSVRFFNVLHCGDVWIKRFYKERYQEFLSGIQQGMRELVNVTNILSFKTISETITNPYQESLAIREKLLKLEELGLMDLMYDRARKIKSITPMNTNKDYSLEDKIMNYIEIEDVLKAPIENVYRMLSVEIGLEKIGLKEANVDIAKKWLLEKHDDFRRLICNSWTVKTYLSSNREQDKVLLVAAIADLISSLITGIGAITVAVLIVREGLLSLCDEQTSKQG